MPDKIKEWGTPLIWVVGLIFVCGVTYNSVGSIDRRVETNTGDIKANTQSIHDEALARKEMSGDIKATREDVGEMKQDFKDFQKYLMQWEFKPKDVD